MLYYFISFVYKYLKMQQQLISKDYIQMAPMPNNKNANINKIFGKIDNIITESQFNQLHIPINIKDENGDSILHHILRNSLNEEEALRKIIVIPNIKSLINVVDSKGRTPMHLICKYQYYNVFKFIVDDEYILNEDQRIILNMFNNKNTLTQEVIDDKNTLTQEVIDSINKFTNTMLHITKDNKLNKLAILNDKYKCSYELYNQYYDLYNKINNYIIKHVNIKNKPDVNLEYILYIILYTIDNYRYITFETFKKIDEKQLLYSNHESMYRFIMELVLLRYNIFMLKETYNLIIDNDNIIDEKNSSIIKTKENSFVGGDEKDKEDKEDEGDKMINKIGILVNKIALVILCMYNIMNTLLTNLKENKEILKKIIQQIENNKKIKIKSKLNDLDNLFNSSEYYCYENHKKGISFEAVSFLWCFKNKRSSIIMNEDNIINEISNIKNMNGYKIKCEVFKEYMYKKNKNIDNKDIDKGILITDEEIDNILIQNKNNNINYLIFDYKQKTPLNYLLHGVINNKSMVKIDNYINSADDKYDDDIYRDVIHENIHITIDNNNINIRFINIDFIKNYINIIKNKISLLYNTFVDNRRLEYFIDNKNKFMFKNKSDDNKFIFVNKSNDIMNNFRIYLFNQLNDNILIKYLNEDDKNIIEIKIFMYNIYVSFLNKIGIKNKEYNSVCKQKIKLEDIKDRDIKNNIRKDIDGVKKINGIKGIIDKIIEDIKDKYINDKIIKDNIIKIIKKSNDKDRFKIADNIKNIKDIRNIENKNIEDKIIAITKNEIIRDIRFKYIKDFKYRFNNKIKSIINNIVDNELLKLYEDKKPLIIKALSSIN